MNHEYVKKNWVGFDSDGASNILNRKSSVGVKLEKVYLNIMLRHYMQS